MEDSIDLAIAYRIYPGISKTPPIFADDKLKLCELCLKSFKLALGGVDVKIWVILDNCPVEYEELFNKYFSPEEIEFVRVEKAGNPKTFKKQMEILATQELSEYVYFAEDDYFYFPDAFYQMLELIKTGKNVHFISPYDHNDYYELDFHNYKSKVNFNYLRHWRTAGTTCMTFMTTKTILRDNWDVFMTYTRKNYDASLWMSLTKQNVWNFGLFFRYLFTNFNMAKIFIKLWLYTPFQALLGKKHFLYTPVPSFATHMDSQHLAPGIDWETHFNRLNEINF